MFGNCSHSEKVNGIVKKVQTKRSEGSTGAQIIISVKCIITFRDFSILSKKDFPIQRVNTGDAELESSNIFSQGNVSNNIVETNQIITNDDGVIRVKSKAPEDIRLIFKTRK